MASFLGLRIIHFLALLGNLILANHVLVEGRVDRSSMLMKEQQLNIERQLNLLNKSPVKTMHTAWGDIYDCIEIHKQPALDHPLLKDHKIEMQEDSVSTNSLNSFINQVDECPKGTVPIRRTTREDLIRANLLSNSESNQYRAGVSYVTKLGETIYGASGVVNVWNPIVNQDQFSSAEITLQSGSGEQMSVIKYGWTVDPQLYGDNVTRSFVYWTADGGKKTGCYNTLCPGFVQVHPKWVPEMPFSHASKIDGTQVTFSAQITLDDAEGKWWLTIQRDIRIGYWPKALFPAFAPGAASVFWGGRVKSGIDGMSPPMCSGQPINDAYPAKAGFINSLQYVDMDNQYVNPEKIESIIDCPEHYNAKYFQGNSDLHFGGSGGANCK
ncbi:hypothetical protein MKW98_032757 [Papaver atlanticum]|uniref:Neprosin PEP catalytic domain-containing protein n=1 Tax=Papaver atlanticum TaxID=357466 RepID=A0AAD4RZR2_9MAGN|nr:hypothetical protein MKW98_032757 [Papaver atlanticum]